MIIFLYIIALAIAISRKNKFVLLPAVIPLWLFHLTQAGITFCSFFFLLCCCCSFPMRSSLSQDPPSILSLWYCSAFALLCEEWIIFPPLKFPRHPVSVQLTWMTLVIKTSENNALCSQSRQRIILIQRKCSFLAPKYMQLVNFSY